MSQSKKNENKRLEKVLLNLKVKLLALQSRSPLLYLSALIALNLLILLPQSRFDPDPHHDGYMFAGAVAASEGKIPNRDFLAQYGPLVPLIQGLSLRIFGENLINLRILTSFILALTGYLIYFLIAQFRSKSLAFTAQILWILSYPIQPLPHSMPWASVISSFLMLLTLYAYLKVKTTLSHPTWAIILGLIIGSLFLIRIQLILLFLFTQINFLYKRKQRFPKSEQNSVLLISVAAFTSFAASIFFMYWAGSLKQYILQCITWPSKFYGQANLPTNFFTKDGLIYWSTWYYYPLFFVSIFLLLKVFRRSKKLPLRNLRWFQILAIILIALFVSLSYDFFTKYDFYPKSYLNPILQFQWLLLRIPLAFFFFLAVLFVFKFFYELLNLNLLVKDNFVLFIALSSALLLYPGSGPIHLWWSSAVLLSAYFFENNYKFFNKEILRDDYVTKMMFLVLIFFAFLLIPNHIGQDREPFESPILKGMLGRAENVKDIDSTISALNIYESSGRMPKKMFFDCRDGLYSVASGSFSSVGPQFVNWGLEVLSTAPDGSPVFICNTTQDEILRIYPIDRYRIAKSILLTNGKINAIVEPKL